MIDKPVVPEKMCAVCSHRLNPRFAEDHKTLIGYEHALNYLNEDHVARPVNLVSEEVQLICDFCLTPDPVWDFPCDDIVGAQTKDTILLSVNDWAACVACHDLIVRDKMDALAERCMDGHLRKMSDGQRESYERAPSLMAAAQLNMVQQMENFSRARTGPAIPLKQATWVATHLREELGGKE